MRYHLTLIFSLAATGILIYLIAIRVSPEIDYRPEPPVPDFRNLATTTAEDAGISEPESQPEDLSKIIQAAPEVTEPVLPAEVPVEKDLSVSQIIDFQEKNIDIRAVVLVRCLLQTQFYSISSQPWNEQQYNIGSGVIISPEGYILTARHILDPREELSNDPAGRVWERKHCEVATVESSQEEISLHSDNLFRRAEVVYKPGEEQYRDSAGLDFSVLKTGSDRPLPYFPLVPKIASLPEGAPVVALGFPGREVASPQKLERFDAALAGLTYYEESSCDGTIMPCGIRYFLKRYPYDYENDFWKPTPLGIITPYFRGGFSGAPVFYKGNLIGIITHGRSGDSTKSGWDEAFALTSYDIFETIKSLISL